MSKPTPPAPSAIEGELLRELATLNAMKKTPGLSQPTIDKIDEARRLAMAQLILRQRFPGLDAKIALHGHRPNAAVAPDGQQDAATAMASRLIRDIRAGVSPLTERTTRRRP